jgi:hypothetical protein
MKVLQPIQDRRAKYTESQVVEIIETGSRKARARAEQTMVEVRNAMQMTLTTETGPVSGIR